MTTLTQVAQNVRRAVIFSLFIIVLGGFLFIIYSSIKSTITKLRPPPSPIVTTTFGKISEIKFPQRTFPFDVKFSVETISGRIPEASPTAKIYFLPKKQQGLLTNIRAIQDAKKIGFEKEPQIVDKKLLFRDSGREFIIDPVSRNFIFNYDFVNDGSVFEGENKLNKSYAVSLALNFLNLLSALPQDYSSQEPKVTFLTFNGKEFVPVDDEKDIESATAARVDFFRKKIDGVPVVTPQYNEGNIFVIISKSQDKNKQVIKAQKFYQEISYENIGIYPLRQSSLAWVDFLKGSGYIASPGNSIITKRVVIRDSFIAYYDNNQTQSYLLPVYVFVGDNGFIGYANAVSPEWLTR